MLGTSVSLRCLIYMRTFSVACMDGLKWMPVRQKAGAVMRWVPHQMWGQNDVWRWDYGTQTYGHLNYAEHVRARLSQGLKCFLCKTALRQTFITHVENGFRILTIFLKNLLLKFNITCFILITESFPPFIGYWSYPVFGLARVSGENLSLILDDIVSTINTICSQKLCNSITIGWLFTSMELNA